MEAAAHGQATIEKPRHDRSSIGLGARPAPMMIESRKRSQAIRAIPSLLGNCASLGNRVSRAE